MKAKAIWWFSPSLLESVDGPWGQARDFENDPVITWRAIIDWAASLRFNRIITGVAPNLTDRIINQWPFHYVCRFPDDPQARSFDEATIERHITTVRQIASYGRERGVPIMLHHYNCIAPEKWLKTHPVLDQKMDAVDDPAFGKRSYIDRLGRLLGNVCWSERVYKDFMDHCWRELFHNIPELEGIMMTAGEFNYCSCEACAGNNPADIFEQQQTEFKESINENRVKMCLNLIQTFHKTMLELDRKPIVRTWMMDQWLDQLPDDCEYAIKFSVFDACWGQPDPQIFSWLDCGKRMWMTKAIEAENSGPLLWHDQRWCEETAKKINQTKSVGTIIHLNGTWGQSGLSTFTNSRNVQRLAERLDPVVSKGESLDDFIVFFGKEAGEHVCNAARLIASVPLHMTSILFLKCEGFNYGFYYWFSGPNRWPGVLGTEGMDAPNWANPDGLTSMTQLMHRSESGVDCLEKLLENPANSVISRLDEMIGWSSEAVKLLDSCSETVKPSAKAELRGLIASGGIAKGLAAEYSNILRARLAWHVYNHLPENSPYKASVYDSVLNYYGRGIECLRTQLGWALQLDNKDVDFAFHVGDRRETYFQFPIGRRLKLREDEYKNLAPITT